MKTRIDLNEALRPQKSAREVRHSNMIDGTGEEKLEYTYKSNLHVLVDRVKAAALCISKLIN